MTNDLDRLIELEKECRRVGIIDRNNHILSNRYQTTLTRLSNKDQEYITDILVNICNNNLKLLRYCLINNTLDVHLKCPICGKDRKFNGKFFWETCNSRECRFKAIERTTITRYNTKCSLNSEIGIRKKKQTWLNHYGTDNPSKSKIIKNKKEQTCLKHFGVKCHLQSEEIISNIINTNIIKYGVRYPNQNIDVHRKRLDYHSYRYNNINFDSSWELYYYLYCINNNITIEREPVRLEYYIDNIKHYYYPDFRINNNQLIEIKSEYLLNNIDINKLNCIKDNNVKIISDKDIYYYIDWCKEFNIDIRKYRYKNTKHKSILKIPPTTFCLEYKGDYVK